MSESRRDLFKLSVLSAVGLSSCAAVSREPQTGTPSATPRRDTVVNQSDIFAWGKKDDSGALYWFLLQWLPGDQGFAAYYAEGSHSYDNKPDVILATCNSSGWNWALVHPRSTITITDKYGVGDDTTAIKVGANSIISRDLLVSFLYGHTDCAMAQRSWSEINRS